MLGMSSIFASGVNWAEQYISLTGKSTAVLVVAAATGEMVVPIVVGQLFDKKGPISLMYVVLVVAICTGIIFLLLLRLAIGRKPINQHQESSRCGEGGSGRGSGGSNSMECETSGFLTDMETLDGGLTIDDEDNGDLGARSRNRNEQTSFFDKLRSSNRNNSHRPIRPSNGKRVTFNLNDQHEYRKLTS